MSKPGFMIIDEGFGNFDRDNLLKFGRVYQYLRNKYKFVLLISHIDQMRYEVNHTLPIQVKHNHQGLEHVSHVDNRVKDAVPGEIKKFSFPHNEMKEKSEKPKELETVEKLEKPKLKTVEKLEKPKLELKTVEKLEKPKLELKTVEKPKLELKSEKQDEPKLKIQLKQKNKRESKNNKNKNNKNNKNDKSKNKNANKVKNTLTLSLK